MKFLSILPFFLLDIILHASELYKNNPSYFADYTSSNLTKIDEYTNYDEHKYYQKVVLDHDNVYRLKTFKKQLFTTPLTLRNMINLEAKLSVKNNSKFANKKRILIKSL